MLLSGSIVILSIYRDCATGLLALYLYILRTPFCMKDSENTYQWYNENTTLIKFEVIIISMEKVLNVKLIIEAMCYLQFF